MKDLYFKVGGRYHPVEKMINFTGFPANGIFIVNDGQSLVCDDDCLKRNDLKRAVQIAVVANVLNKELDSNMGFMNNINHFLDIHDFKYDIDDKKKITQYDQKKIDFYEKKGSGYKKIAESFNSFKSLGIYMVINGLKNKTVKLDPKSVYFDYDKDVIKSEVIDYIKNNNVSYFMLIQKISELIVNYKTSTEK